jgi:hypothetical protein
MLGNLLVIAVAVVIVVRNKIKKERKKGGNGDRKGAGPSLLLDHFTEHLISIN